MLLGIAVGSQAVAGVIHQPYYNYQTPGAKLGRTFYGVVGAGVRGLTSAAPPDNQRIITTTRSHGTGLVQDALDILKPDQVLKVGGAGHKVILLMEGKATAYVFPSPGKVLTSREICISVSKVFLCQNYFTQNYFGN